MSAAIARAALLLVMSGRCCCPLAVSKDAFMRSSPSPRVLPCLDLAPAGIRHTHARARHEPMTFDACSDGGLLA